MRMIEQGLQEHGNTISTLGEIIHNPQAVERLRERGIRPVSSLDDVEEGTTLVIRAHGVHPGIIEEAKKRGIKLLDATCPFVLKSQYYVRRLFESSFHVIIIGDSNHPEVRSLSGHAGGRALIINNVDEAERAEPMERAGLVIQTTFSEEKAREIINVLRDKIQELKVYDTICQATVLRREATLELAERVDLMLVVGGRESSNTRRLYQMCLDKRIPAKFVERAEEIESEWFRGCRRIGLATGTSTPDWVIDEVLERLDALSRDEKGSTE